MNTEIMEKINSIALQQQSHLWDAMAAFITAGWLDQLEPEQQLLILHTIIFAQGDLGDKVDQLYKFNFETKTKTHIAKFKKQLNKQDTTNILVIEGFILMLQVYIDSIQDQHAVLYSYHQLGPFVSQEMRKNISSYTLTGKQPIYESEATNLFENLNNIHNTIRTLHYLSAYHISEAWDQYPVNTYNILELHQAQCLNVKQTFRDGLNTPDDHQITFYAQTWILELMNKNFKLGLKVAENPNAQQLTSQPFENYPELNQQLQSIHTPDPQREAIKAIFLDSMTKIQICFDNCLIDTLPIIKTFEQ
ncbi:hypothetical protein GO495_06575 [Chitinophaga oryziterrae]|uniref:Uncharacterized protein n=1 Tax=Chitinophaga oryziterrae TaxID=1031224 RepID=A0A6N8J7P9_9BACT|nr:hypothetical protein [Chitinophaga oryziterrae]MVT40239.1 hypothetical protein [Chitinophaga oryziterrae]